MRKQVLNEVAVAVVGNGVNRALSEALRVLNHRHCVHWTCEVNASGRLSETGAKLISIVCRRETARRYFAYAYSTLMIIIIIIKRRLISRRNMPGTLRGRVHRCLSHDSDIAKFISNYCFKYGRSNPAMVRMNMQRYKCNVEMMFSGGQINNIIESPMTFYSFYRL